MTETQQYWHFLPDHGMTRFDPRVLVAPGQTQRIDDSPVLCKRGFHACLLPLDAAEYAAQFWDEPATGRKVQRCTLEGIVLDGGKKHCAQERTCLWVADATRTLHEFSCDTVEAVLSTAETRGEVVDPRLRQTTAVKRAWLDGNATDQELAAAVDVAWAVFKGAAAVASRSSPVASWDAAAALASVAASVSGGLGSSAVRAALSSACGAANTAWDAVDDAVDWTASWYAAWAELNADLERRLLTLAPNEAAG